jgi:PAS domain S-box-containing protein
METAKIFIVEDEPIEAMDLALVLERLGYTISGSVMSGEECLVKVKADRPDLVIMDIKLRGEMDGIDTVWELRKILDVPVIFSTAMSDQSSLARAKLTEPYGYIIKPFNERELYTTIETSLYRHRIDHRLKESETKYRTLFEQSRDAIYLSDLDGMIMDANRAMIRLTGYGTKGLTGINIKDLFVDPAEGERALGEIRERGFIDSLEIRIRKSDGAESDCLLTATRIVAADGVDFGCQGIIRDVTGQKRLERIRDILVHEKVKHVKELNCLYRLTQISGDINTPLDDIFRQTIEIIPYAFQNPAIIAVKIRYHDRAFASREGDMDGESLASNVQVFGMVEGDITVYNTGRTASGDDELFSKEERDMVNAIAERLGIIIERNRTFQDLALSREELRGLSAHLQSLQESERTAIAREIHDVLGQSLTAMKMDISWIKNRLKGKDELIARAEAMSGLIDGTIDTVRRLSSELRPDLLDDLGLGAAIEWHAEQFQKRTGIACTVTSNIGDRIIDEMKSINIYRIFQESLTNIIRHANATHVDVDLNVDDRALTLTVRDNGRGINEDEINNPRSLGLIGVRERALSCGGAIDIKGAKDSGTVMTAHIPL